MRDVERIVSAQLEAGFGAMSDWLEMVRAHELRRREREAARRRARRAQAASVVAALLCGACAVALAILARVRSS